MAIAEEKVAGEIVSHDTIGKIRKKLPVVRRDKTKLLLDIERSKLDGARKVDYFAFETSSLEVPFCDEPFRTSQDDRSQYSRFIASGKSFSTPFPFSFPCDLRNERVRIRGPKDD